MKYGTLFLCLLDHPAFCAVLRPFLRRVPVSSPAPSVALSPSAARAPAPIHYKIIAAAGHSFGYDIYSNGKILVHQVSIPGLPGNQGFTRRKDAEKVAALVVKKLEKNIMPPTVTRAEMDDLKIKY